MVGKGLGYIVLAVGCVMVVGGGCAKGNLDSENNQKPTVSNVRPSVAGSALPLSEAALREAQSKDDHERIERYEAIMRQEGVGPDNPQIAENIRQAILRDYAGSLVDVRSACRAVICRIELDMGDRDFEAKKALMVAMVANYPKWAVNMSSVDYVRRGTVDTKGRLYVWRARRLLDEKR